MPLSTLQYWLARAADRELDEVEWTDRSSAPHRTGRLASSIEDRVLRARAHLRDRTALGEFGAVAIREYLLKRYGQAPSIRTIGRILERRGALDGAVRVRRPPPPPGWYLPDVAAKRVELDSFDTVMGLVLDGGREVEVFNGVSLHGGVVGSWPTAGVRARDVVEFLVEHWQEFGLPDYAQFDNDTRFQGTHRNENSFGRVIRLCLSLKVVPIFAPPREPGFQGAIESYNGRWQAKVWSRFWHASLASLRRRSQAYVQAHRLRNAPRADAAPSRRPFPARWSLDLQAPLRGRAIYIRRTNDAGVATLLEQQFLVRHDWLHRLVRAEVNFDDHRIRFFALRRRDPGSQPLLRTVIYQPPTQPFRERSR